MPSTVSSVDSKLLEVTSIKSSQTEMQEEKEQNKTIQSRTVKKQQTV